MPGMFDPIDLAERPGKADEAGLCLLPVPVGAPPPPGAHPVHGAPAASWAYHDRRGALLGYVHRFATAEGKTIAPMTCWQDRDGRQSWRWKTWPEPRPLYGLQDLAERPTAPVLIVEGEKTVDAAARLFPDYACTTSSSGARSAAKADWAPVAGRKVTIWRDADAAGEEYAEDVARLATEAGATSVSVVDLPATFPQGWDLADQPPDGYGLAQLRVLLDSARLAPAADLPDLSLSNETVKPAPALPLEVFGAEWSRWLGLAAEGCSAPVDYVAFALLVAASGLIGNNRWASPWAGWKEPPVLWVALVGRPSSNKSPGQDVIRDLLAVLEAELGGDYAELRKRWLSACQIAKIRRKMWEKDLGDAVKSSVAPPDMPHEAIEPPEPARPRLSLADATPEALAKIAAVYPRAPIHIRDELAGWLESFGRYNSGGDRALWLEAYGGRGFTVDRVKTGLEPIHIRNLSIAILGGIQPDRLASALMAGDDDGLDARFMKIWPEAVALRRPRSLADTAMATNALRKLRDLAMAIDDAGAPVPRVLMLTEEAAATFEAWRREHAQGDVGVSGRLAAQFGKMPGLVLRLALVIELLWWSVTGAPEPASVGNPAVTAAIALVEEYLKPMAVRCYADAALPQAERDAATLARWIRVTRPNMVNARRLQREIRLPGLTKVDRLNAAISVLAEGLWLFPAPTRQSSAKGGRPRGDFRINPKIWEV